MEWRLTLLNGTRSNQCGFCYVNVCVCVCVWWEGMWVCVCVHAYVHACLCVCVHVCTQMLLAGWVRLAAMLPLFCFIWKIVFKEETSSYLTTQHVPTSCSSSTFHQRGRLTLLLCLTLHLGRQNTEKS